MPCRKGLRWRAATPESHCMKFGGERKKRQEELIPPGPFWRGDRRLPSGLHWAGAELGLRDPTAAPDLLQGWLGSLGASFGPWEGAPPPLLLPVEKDAESALTCSRASSGPWVPPSAPG